MLKRNISIYILIILLSVIMTNQAYAQELETSYTWDFSLLSGNPWRTDTHGGLSTANFATLRSQYDYVYITATHEGNNGTSGLTSTFTIRNGGTGSWHLYELFETGYFNDPGGSFSWDGGIIPVANFSHNVIYVSGQTSAFTSQNTSLSIIFCDELPPKPPESLKVNIVGSGSVHVTSSANDIDEVIEETKIYEEVEHGSSVKLEVISDIEKGINWHGWTGDLSGEDLIEYITMDDSKEVTANFIEVFANVQYKMSVTRIFEKYIDVAGTWGVSGSLHDPYSLTELFMYNMSFKTEDRLGKKIEGKFVICPTDRFFPWKFRLGIPWTTLTTFDDVGYYRHVSNLTTVNFYGISGVPGYAPSYFGVLFIPNDSDLNVGYMVVNLESIRELENPLDLLNPADSDDLTNWNPGDYGSYIDKVSSLNVRDTDTVFNPDRDSLPSIFDDAKMGGYETDPTYHPEEFHEGGLGGTIGKLLQPAIDDLTDEAMNRAPFAYIMLVLQAMENMKDSIGSDAIELTIGTNPFFGEDVTMDLTDFSGIFSTVRSLSTIVIYLFIGLYFLTVYKRITGG